MDVPYDKLLPALNRLLPDRVLDALGDATKFIRRLRQISASAFVWSVVLSRFGQGSPGFEQARQWFCRLTGGHVWPRPFQMRFKSAAAVRLFEQAFEQAVAPWRRACRRLPRHPLARQFADVVAWDSSLLQVDDNLRPIFKGARGAAASLKVALGVSIWGLLPVAAGLVAGHRHDMLLGPPLELFRPGTLWLFDKGFVAYERLARFDEAAQSFLCPMRLNGNPEIVQARRAPPNVRALLRERRLNLHSFGARPVGPMLRSVLPAKRRISKCWDLDVVVRADNKRPVLVRLVIVPGPDGKQRPYLTNLPAAVWNPRLMREMYRLRWQIELVFKELKQHVNLTSLPSKDPYAVQLFVWASLIALAVSRAVGDWLMPLREFNGLASALRLAVVTRAVRGNVQLLGYAIRLPASQACAFITAFGECILDEARQRSPGREDSLQRLKSLAKAA